MINFKCQCGKSYSVNDEMAGRTASCQQCGQKIIVPSPKPSGTVPVPPIQQTAPAPKQLFCTNCGNTISEQAVACMSCGARPVGHKRFCHQCGVGLNPEQIVCIKCGTGLTAASGCPSVDSNISPQAKKLNINFMVSWICMATGISLQLLGTIQTHLGAYINTSGRGDANNLLIVGMTFTMISVPVIIAGSVFGCMLFYQLWKQIPMDIARTTPGKAVGFSLIPFFNVYWNFVACKGLGEDMNKTLRRYGIQYQVNENLGTSLCILAIISYIPFNAINLFIGSYIGLAVMAALFTVAIFFIKSVKDGAIALLDQEGQ